VALNCDIVIVGGGVLGLCVAVELTARGHDVVVLDPGGPNASSIAAGMIAPALESALDGVSPELARLMREAADLWPAFAHQNTIELKPGPAVWRGDTAQALAKSAQVLGFHAEVRGDTVWTDDRQVEPGPALEALRRRAGQVHDRQALSIAQTRDRWIVMTAQGAVEARSVVLATGTSEALEGLPEAVKALVAGIVPIRGQIGGTGLVLGGGVWRGPGGYVVPMAEGSVIGATMGEGRRDLTVDASEAEALLAVAARLTGQDVSPQSVDWRVGIRGATADGLPMAGLSGEPGLLLALAPRRNGWLLGPLVGQIVADGIEGCPPAAHAAALDPRRFLPGAEAGRHQVGG